VRRTAVWFAIGSALVCGALAAVTWRILDLEQRQRVAAADARGERMVSEALLRMDLAVMPLLAGEAARWQPGEPPGVPATRGWDTDTARVLGQRFAIAGDGSVIATGDGSGLPIAALRAAAPAFSAAPAPRNALPVQTADPGTFTGRSQFVQNNFAQQSEVVPWRTGVEASAFTAVFLPADDGPHLYFVRRLGGAIDAVQGIAADWPAFERWLCDQVADLLPAARLVPGGDGEPGRRLASLPALLAPGPIPAAVAEPRATVPWLLSGTWLLVLLALGAVGFALHAAHALAERRARFVSSVTHELRTPLSTFQMYTQMLAGGMVPEAARGEYLATLQRESERLVRIVESVLLYARLEGGRGGPRRIELAADELLGRVLPPLQQRCREAGHELVAAVQVPAVGLRVDPQAIEQVLYNLVDNACKYGAPPVRCAAVVGGGELVVTVSDGGPGIDAREAAAVFGTFHRGEAQRNGSVPGLGLGLAIARELAAAMDGRLELVAGGAGAVFRLRLRCAGGVAGGG
jgi:signal transduction histidine kinase